MTTKIVISPDNKKAIAFLEALNKRKEEIRKKYENMPFPATLKEKNNKSDN